MKPQPQPKDIVCSECGLAWDLHKPDDKKGVEMSECVRLLKAELARRPQWSPHGITYGNPQATWTIGSAS